MFLEERPLRSRHFYHILFKYLLSTWPITVDADFDHLVQVVFVSLFLLYGYSIFLPFRHCTLQKEVSTYLHLSSGSKYLYNYLEMSVSYPQFIYLWSYLFTLIYVQKYLFYSFVIIQCYFIYFVLLKLFQLWPLGTLSVDSYAPLTYIYHCLFFGFVFFFKNLNTSWHCELFQALLIYPWPSHSYFSKMFCFIFWEWYYKPRCRLQACSLLLGCHCFGLSQLTKKGNMCVF